MKEDLRFPPPASSDGDISESVDELKARLSSMKQLMAERQAAGASSGQDPQAALYRGRAHRPHPGLISGGFLSFVFGSALVVILSVSCYAFYNLYHAVLKRFPSRHTEL